MGESWVVERKAKSVVCRREIVRRDVAAKENLPNGRPRDGKCRNLEAMAEKRKAAFSFLYFDWPGETRGRIYSSHTSSHMDVKVVHRLR